MFLFSILQVELTWDETDKDRTAVTMRKFDKDELEEMDVKQYLASSSSEGEDGEHEEISWGLFLYYWLCVQRSCFARQCHYSKGQWYRALMMATTPKSCHSDNLKLCNF